MKLDRFYTGSRLSSAVNREKAQIAHERVVEVLLLTIAIELLSVLALLLGALL